MRFFSTIPNLAFISEYTDKSFSKNMQNVWQRPEIDISNNSTEYKLAYFSISMLKTSKVHWMEYTDLFTFVYLFETTPYY